MALSQVAISDHTGTFKMKTDISEDDDDSHGSGLSKVSRVNSLISRRKA
jgi:hypothetical protein